jgi:phosphomannomutase
VAEHLRTVSADEFAKRLRRTTEERDKRFAFFVGAGCSISSDIPAASQLVKNQWLPQLFSLRAGPAEEFDTWVKRLFPDFNPNDAAASYGTVMKELFLQPEDRQREIERLCDGRFPGFGYGCLASLMTIDGGLFNVVLTTNFDDLLSDALYLFTDARPLVIQHDSLAPLIRTTRTRPLIVKLHGDNRLSPRNTAQETERLMDDIENKVRLLLHDRGLIFVGYGGNDAGIREMLEALPAEALPLGVYWVSGHEPAGQIRSWLDARQAIWVPSNDFDELMLLIKDAFMLGHPKRRRFDYVFENYAATYYSLSNQIATWPRNTEEQRVLGSAAKRAGSTQPIRKYKLSMRDGVRGLTGEWPLDRVTLWKIGKALANSSSCSVGDRAQFVIAHDGREGADEVAARVAAGLQFVGARVLYGGCLPTPAVAFLTKKLDLSGGVMVTASHSIHTMNGLKLFWKHGKRVPDHVESEIEKECEAYDNRSYSEQISKPLQVDVQLKEQYIKHLREPIEGVGRGHNLVIDCANGACSGLVREVFKHTSIRLDVLNDSPNGRNINLRSGSTHLDSLGQSEQLKRAHLGAAFDGDGDRILFLLPEGRLIDGDQVLLALATHFKNQARLPDNRVVGTELSSIALEQRFQNEAIEFHRAAVGDKHVLKLMESLGSLLGGEPSGNVIIHDRTPSGDGLVALTEVL